MAAPMRKAWLVNPDSPAAGLLPERLLAGRGLATPESAAAFLNPSLELLHDPFLLPDMDKACILIGQVLKDGGLITIHGDYDVDGITATALLVRFLRSIGARIRSMIPDRLTDGYGLTSAGTAVIIESGCDLLITVDCGISSIDEVDQLVQAGIPVIITDHHTCKETLPAAAAVINPKRSDSRYPFTGLSGVGVAFKLVQALCRTMVLGDRWLEHLDLVALGTVADVVPLIDENRILVRFGLDLLNSHLPSPAKTCGLSVLIGLSAPSDRTCSARTLGYSVAPRINASGRLGSAEDALELLLADDPMEAERYARRLIECNRLRQEIEAAVTAEAIQEIDRTFDFDKPDFIIAAHPDWHPGVIGIVASRLADHYCRPAIVMTGDDGRYRGSCRSWGSIDILDALDFASKHLIRYGGHPRAAGLTLDPGSLDDFRTALGLYAAVHIPPEAVQPILPADLEVTAADLTLENARAITRMEPFGEGNPVPQLIIRSLILREVRTVGSNGRHLKISLNDPPTRINLEGIAFGSGDADDWLQTGDTIDLLFALEINEWQGRESVQLNIGDIHLSSKGDEFHDEPWVAELFFQDGGSIETLMSKYDLPLQAFLPDEREYKVVYQYLKSRIGHESGIFDVSLLAARISRSYQMSLHPFRLARILAVFHETGLVCRQSAGNRQVRLRLLPIGEKVRLDQSATYQRLLLETGGECGHE